MIGLRRSVCDDCGCYTDACECDPPDFCDCDDCWGFEPTEQRPVVDVTAFAEAGLL